MAKGFYERIIVSLLSHVPICDPITPSDILNALNEIGLEFKDGEIVSIKTDPCDGCKIASGGCTLTCSKWKEYYKTGVPETDFGKKELKKIEQNPAWSEEDKRIIDNLVSQLGNLYARKLIKEETKDKYVNWLKSLKDRVQPQPKQEWSEEDREMRMKVLKFLSTRCNVFEYEEVENWLKSLRPQSTWKPSKEQMHYLSWIANIKLGDSVVEQEVSKHLNELLEDLKKLKDGKV